MTLAILVGLAFVAGCKTTDDTSSGDNEGGGTASRPDTERAERGDNATIPVGEFTEVLVETWNGSIGVIGTPAATDFTVTSTIFAMGPTTAEADQRCKDIQLIAAADPNTPTRLHVRVEFPGGHPPVTSGARITVAMPQAPKVIVKANNSSVRIATTSGDVAVTTNKGEVTVIDVAGSVEIKTTEKSVACLRIGGNVEVNTTIGTIQITEFGGKLKLKNSQGHIEIFHDKPTEPVDIQAETSGNITSELPGTIKAQLILAAPSGTVEASSLDDGIPVTDRITSTNNVRCKINGGGEGKIEYTAHNGTLTYKVKEFTKPVGGGDK